MELAQLARIAEMAGQPNVTVQGLPFTAGAHPAMLGSFTLMQFPDPADKDVVYLWCTKLSSEPQSTPVIPALDALLRA